MHDTSFPEGWHEWVAAAKAKPVYGAKSFLKYADKKVSIFTIFLTVIKKKILKLQGKFKNIGLPQAKDNHILLKGKNDKSKASRRQQVEKS